MPSDSAPSVLLPGYDFKPAWWATRRRLRRLPSSDKLPGLPVGIIIHSGATGPGTAEWAWQIDKTTGLGAAWYWAQFAWWAKENRFVQTDYLDAWAPHGGPYNKYSIGIELAGPWRLNPRPELHKEATVALVKAVLMACPTITWITGHEFTEATKRDPGPGVDASWWSGLGLEVHWQWVGLSLLPKPAW